MKFVAFVSRPNHMENPRKSFENATALSVREKQPRFLLSIIYSVVFPCRFDYYHVNLSTIRYVVYMLRVVIKIFVKKKLATKPRANKMMTFCDGFMQI